MPSTLVHVAISGLLAAALLREEFGWRSLLVVLGSTAFLDLDAFVGLVLPGAHRSLFHSLFVPLVLSLGLVLETNRKQSVLEERFDGRGRRVGSVAILAVAVGGIGPDLVTNGVNLLYPLTDTFVQFDGALKLSSTQGIVQTFVEPTGQDGSKVVVGSSRTIHYSTGVNPRRGTEPESVERVFPIVRSGLQLLLVLASATVVSFRLWEERGT
ncbi:MAG: metal-dependent hydrolase [Halodesulfurarchaeum sp.]